MDAELAALRAVRMKLVASPEQVARATGFDDGAVATLLGWLAEQGLVTSTPRGWRVTPDGQAQLAAGLEAEQRGVDPEAARALHARFAQLDRELKRLLTEHQTSGGDAIVADALARLEAVDDGVAPIAEEAAGWAPRLTPYRGRLGAARVAVVSGDVRFLAHPLLDSYHTVWFELHEELLHLARLSRAEVADPG